MRDTRLGDSLLPSSPDQNRALVRTPLLPPALAFAAGCAWGSSGILPFLPTLAIAALIAAFWLRAAYANVSFYSFLATVFFLGFLGASVHREWKPAHDLRRLPRTQLRSDSLWEGTVLTVPAERVRDGKTATTAIFAIHRAWIAGCWQAASGRVLLQVGSAPPGALALSQHLRLWGRLRELGRPRNPGEPDWREILSVRRVTYRLHASWNDVQPLDSGSWLGQRINAARRWASQLLRRGVESDRQAAALVSGMIYGQTGELSAQTEDEFRLAGAYHIFAVSGQNVGAFLAVGFALLEASRVSRWRWGWMLLPAVLFYALFSGGSASVGRAALLSVLVLIAWVLRRPVDLLNFWGACLLLFLAFDPLSVRDVSLQLSFGVVLALLLLAPPLARCLAAPFRPDPFIPRSLLPHSARIIETGGRVTAFLLASSLAAAVGALPFEVLHFHFISLIGPFANLLVVPLAELVVTAGIVSLCFGSFWSLLGVLLNNANWLFARILLAVVAFASRLPASGIAAPDPSVLLSHSSGLRLLFPAIPLGSACLIRSHGKVLLVHAAERGLTFARIEPIRRFYGWNWLDAEIRSNQQSWIASRRVPWGKEGAFAPFERLRPAPSLCLEATFNPLRGEARRATQTMLLIRDARLPLLALALSSPSGEATQEGTMDLIVPLRTDPTTPLLHLALREQGAWLGEVAAPLQPGRPRPLGRNAVEVILGPDRIDFRPYRGQPVVYPIERVQDDEGATSQTPSSPEGTVQ